MKTGTFIDLTVGDRRDDYEEFLSTQLSQNSNFDEQNHDANGNLVPDFQPDATFGDRIIPSDADLISGFMDISQSAGVTGSWKLNFPRRMKVWTESSPGVWTSVIRGEWTPAVGTSRINFRLEGIDLSTEYGDSTLLATLDSGGQTFTHWAYFDVNPRLPSTPTAVTASIGPDNRIHLTWNAIDDISVGGYGIYRSINGGSFESLYPYLQSDNYFTDNEIAMGATATYRVVALNWAGVESLPVTVTATRPIDKVAPAPPRELTSTSDKFHTVIGWKRSTSTDVAKYRVYTYGEFLEAVSSDARSYDDDGGVGGDVIPYGVSAVDYAGNESKIVTLNVTTTPLDHIAPAPPTNVQVTRDANGVYTITWDANNKEDDFIGYVVARQDSLPGDWYLITDYAFAGNTYVDEFVPEGQEAYYFVAVVDDAYNWSDLVSTDVTPPLPPTNPHAFEAEDGSHLTWTASNSPDTYAYLVENDAGDSGDFRFGRWNFGTEYLDDISVPGVTTHYRVAAIDVYGNRSDFVEVGLKTSLPKPSHVEASVVTSTEVKLEWWDVWYFATFDVYRGTNADFVPSLENRVSYGKRESGFDDTNLGKWTTYYYKIIKRTEEDHASTMIVVNNPDPNNVPTAPERGQTQALSDARSTGAFRETASVATSSWDLIDADEDRLREMVSSADRDTLFSSVTLSRDGLAGLFAADGAFIVRHDDRFPQVDALELVPVIHLDASSLN